MNTPLGYWKRLFWEGICSVADPPARRPAVSSGQIIGFARKFLDKAITEGEMLEQTGTQTDLTSLTAQQKLIAGTIAAFLGTFMMLGVGFANVEVVHNSAHDTRHSVSFPCH